MFVYPVMHEQMTRRWCLRCYLLVQRQFCKHFINIDTLSLSLYSKVYSLFSIVIPNIFYPEAACAVRLYELINGCHKSSWRFILISSAATKCIPHNTDIKTLMYIMSTLRVTLCDSSSPSGRSSLMATTQSYFLLVLFLENVLSSQGSSGFSLLLGF